jgi:transketolase
VPSILGSPSAMVWLEDAKFPVPDGVYEHFAAGIGARDADARRRWIELFNAYRAEGPSNRTLLTYKGAGDVEVGTSASKNLHYSIREHAMAAIVSGMSLSTEGTPKKIWLRA